MLCTRRKMPLPRVLKVLYLQVDFETDEISSWGSCESKTGPQTGVTDQGACSYSLLPALPLPPHPRCPHPGVPPPRCAPLSLGSWSPYPANQGRGLLMILLWFKNQFEFGKRNCDRQQDGGGAQGLNLRPGEPARMWLCCRACGGGRSLKVSLEPGLLGPLGCQARDAGSAAETGSFGLFIATPADLLISRILFKGCVALASCTRPPWLAVQGRGPSAGKGWAAGLLVQPWLSG